MMCGWIGGRVAEEGCDGEDTEDAETEGWREKGRQQGRVLLMAMQTTGTFPQLAGKPRPKPKKKGKKGC